MFKDADTLMDEMIKQQERAAIKGLVATILSEIESKGTSLQSQLEEDAQSLKDYASTYQKISQMDWKDRLPRRLLIF